MTLHTTIHHDFPDPIRRLAVWIFVGVCLFLGLSTPLRAGSGEAEDSPAFSKFEDWWAQYIDASEENRSSLAVKGATLADKRREEMVRLMQADPKTALRIAFPEEYHPALPKVVADSVEEHVRGLAQLTVTHKKDGTVTRTVTMGGETWQAALYGARRQLTSREEIPLHGIVLDGWIAVDGSPLERFPKRETLLQSLRQAEGKKTCPICHQPGTIPAAVGDILLWFDTEGHLETVEKALIEKENSPQPE